MCKDETKPEGKWEFDESVTAAFDDMLQRSIPQYEVMRDAVFNIGSSFATRATSIVDLGCSRGETLYRFYHRFGAYNQFVGVDVSEPMLEAARSRFEGAIACGLVDIRNMDLRTDYPNVRASVTTAVLTIQFTPIEHRMRIVQNVYDATVPGGAFLMVEKVMGGNARIDSLMTDLYYDMKRGNEYTDDDITRKRASLEGVLVPVTAAWNEDMLRSAGFRHVECFWRWMNFAGWIAIKQ